MLYGWLHMQTHATCCRQPPGGVAWAGGKHAERHARQQTAPYVGVSMLSCLITYARHAQQLSKLQLVCAEVTVSHESVR
jgi:hypothetical protein